MSRPRKCLLIAIIHESKAAMYDYNNTLQVISLTMYSTYYIYICVRAKSHNNTLTIIILFLSIQRQLKENELNSETSPI
jgi:hypothetical protein